MSERSCSKLLDEIRTFFLGQDESVASKEEKEKGIVASMIELR